MLKAQLSSDYRYKIARNYLHTSFNKDMRLSKLDNNSTPIVNSNDTLAHVYSLKPKGFLILAASEFISPIIAFSTEANFDFSNHRDNILLQMLRKDMTEQLAFLKTNDIRTRQIANKNRAEWSLLANINKYSKDYDTQYGPFLSSIWGGVNCYDNHSRIINVGNYYTPNHYSPGCVATAMSIIMHYYEWPLQGVGNHTDYDNAGSSTGAYYANFAATKYSWPSMLDEYYHTNSNNNNRKAMGELSYHCSIAVNMNFEYNGSSSNVNRVPDAFNNYFRFSSHYKTSSWYNFWPRMRENIRNNQPVEIAISKTNGEGHAVVCDGYGQDVGDIKYYHLQFGWWGSYDGWYNIQGSWSASGYSIIDGAVFDIVPDAAIGSPIYGNNPFDVTVPIVVSDKLNWDSFKIWESYNGGSYQLVESNYTDVNYKPNITKSGNYKYKVQAKVNGLYYSNNISLPEEVLIKRKDSALVNLAFDGNDSFFVKDNPFDDLDISDNYTIETWVNIKELNANSNWDVIMDRRTVFSLYLIDDTDADYAVRFVTRDGSDNLVASLRSDSSDINLNFNEWVHIAISRYDSITFLFLNGKEVDSSLDTNFSLRYSVYALNFGARYWGGYSRYMIGDMDEVRISDTARYLQDFLPYRCMPFITDSNTVLLLHLDENSGNSLGDESRHFYNTNLRSSPNYPNWEKQEQNVSVVYEEMFTAQSQIKNIGQLVILAWSTSFEQGNSAFEIYKSRDNKTWELITTVDANNNANKIVDYKYEDAMVELGDNYYKLKQISNGCKYSFVGIDSVKIMPKTTISIYPNPSSDKLYVEGLLGVKVLDVQVIDIMGKEVLFHLDSDNNSIDISSFKAGLYFLKIELENRTYVQKFMKVRTLE
ncbi:MAG: hypothetical protein DRI86_10235 [Bacteroidetes bacterium]|nr:MAG: hypothetical protein DRI86_10235 [Bacteroidota bacterium]